MLTTLKRLLVSALRRTNVLRWFNVSLRLQCADRSLRVPLLGGIGAGHFSWARREPWLSPLLRVLLQTKSGALLDVGTNIGQTLIAHLETGIPSDYIGFEPNHCAASYFERFSRANRLDHLRFVPVGLSDRTSILKLFRNGEVSAGASTVEGFRDSSHYSDHVFVPVFKGDDVIQFLNVDEISVVKIDVEGAELEVVTGLADTIHKHRPFVIAEILPVYDEETDRGRFRRTRTDKLLQFFLGEKYNLFRLIHDGTLQSLTTVETHGNLELCEYLFAPQELSDALVCNPTAND
jgi:FkbM family methyltransferase